MLRHSSALTLATLLAAGLLTAAPAGAADEMCQGRPATIVGTGPDIVGTPGDDVIVTGASKITVAGDGDDLICLTPSTYIDPRVDAGPGNDVVDFTASTGFMGVASLGSGVDRYVGGTRGGAVLAQGADDVVSGGEGSISLFLDLSGGMGTSEGRYDGGARSGYINVWSQDLDVELDLARAAFVVGARVLPVERFLSARVVAPRVVLRGTADDNGLSASGCNVRIHGGAGKDSLDTVYGDHPGEPQFTCRRTSRLSGGPGDDKAFGLTGRDRIEGNGGRDWLVGGPGADLLLGGNGQDRLKGSGGGDELRGNGGSDTLTGNSGRDVLIGNGGRDTANGNRHSDRCVAETEKNCDR